MTGHLMVGRWSIRRVGRGWLVKSLVAGPLNERTNQYIHAIFTLDSGDMLALSDLRKFARIDFGKKEYILGLPAIYRLGPDALSRHLTPEVFRNAVGGRKKSIKQALMDPSVIAGIGNIYADDILWSARIHPARRADTLSRAELDRILTYTRKILRTAIRLGGTSISDYRNPSGGSGKYGRAILVYRRAGHPCPRWGSARLIFVLPARGCRHGVLIYIIQT
jgi:formamidopyrimidine-DNA glycosylase